MDKSTLEFFFSSDLDTSVDAVMEFIVQEKISGKEVNIDISQVNEDNKQSVLVLLGEELVPCSRLTSERNRFCRDHCPATVERTFGPAAPATSRFPEKMIRSKCALVRSVHAVRFFKDSIKQAAM